MNPPRCECPLDRLEVIFLFEDSQRDHLRYGDWVSLSPDKTCIDDVQVYKSFEVALAAQGNVMHPDWLCDNYTGGIRPRCYAELLISRLRKIDALIEQNRAEDTDRRNPRICGGRWRRESVVLIVAASTVFITVCSIFIPLTAIYGNK